MNNFFENKLDIPPYDGDKKTPYERWLATVSCLARTNPEYEYILEKNYRNSGYLPNCGNRDLKH